jgi:hypothetical protein
VFHNRTVLAASQKVGSNTVMTLDANVAAPVVVEILDSHSPVPVIAAVPSGAATPFDYGKSASIVAMAG